MLVCRVFLGAFEGLFGTGIVYYLSLWYHRTELSRRLYWYLGPTAIAGAFGGILAYGVGHIKSSVPQWKWLFIIEAVPGFLLGLACLWILPDRPLKNSKFSGEEQKLARARYYEEGIDKGVKIQRKHVVWALCDWRVYMQGMFEPLRMTSQLADASASTHLRADCCPPCFHFRILAHSCLGARI